MDNDKLISSAIIILAVSILFVAMTNILQSCQISKLKNEISNIKNSQQILEVNK